MKTYMKIYMMVCDMCGNGNHIARDDKFAPAVGDTILDFCWTCFTHRKQKVAPEGCLVVKDLCDK